jgi:hypothetical protein
MTGFRVKLYCNRFVFIHEIIAIMKKIFSILISALLFLYAPAQIKAKFPVIIEPKFKKDTVSILKYGAVPDGNTLNTKSINIAIDECNKKGGGVVLVPSG